METLGGKEECTKSADKFRENKLYVCTKSFTMRLREYEETNVAKY